MAPGSYELATQADIIINGIDPGDRLGYTVEVGDVNGDGAPDLAIGAYWATPEGRFRAGEAYVIFGPLP
ncbi:MAG: FG-GAP repeat protein [Proteobacteria bacterium]|nr:FG-GAP repeat protein [Pseudomonadota bacterium]